MCDTQWVSQKKFSWTSSRSPDVMKVFHVNQSIHTIRQVLSLKTFQASKGAHETLPVVAPARVRPSWCSPPCFWPLWQPRPSLSWSSCQSSPSSAAGAPSPLALGPFDAPVRSPAPPAVIFIIIEQQMPSGYKRNCGMRHSRTYLPEPCWNTGPSEIRCSPGWGWCLTHVRVLG